MKSSLDDASDAVRETPSELEPVSRTGTAEVASAEVYNNTAREGRLAQDSEEGASERPIGREPATGNAMEAPHNQRATIGRVQQQVVPQPLARASRDRTAHGAQRTATKVHSEEEAGIASARQGAVVPIFTSKYVSGLTTLGSGSNTPPSFLHLEEQAIGEETRSLAASRLSPSSSVSSNGSDLSSQNGIHPPGSDSTESLESIARAVHRAEDLLRDIQSSTTQLREYSQAMEAKGRQEDPPSS